MARENYWKLSKTTENLPKTAEILPKTTKKYTKIEKKTEILSNTMRYAL